MSGYRRRRRERWLGLSRGRRWRRRRRAWDDSRE